MRKLFLIGILMVLIISISSTEILARSHSNSSSKNYLTFSWFFKPASLGTKLRIANNIYATGNIDHRDFLFLFSEILYPMKIGLDPKYRAGFCIKF